jgi:uncharacterized membrane protein HdeD (DUF308 family)
VNDVCGVHDEKRRQVVSVASMSGEERQIAGEAARMWWIFLVMGILWLWVALIVLRLNLETVHAISILFGIVAIGAGIGELIAIAGSTRWWKVAHGLLGAVCIAAGIVAFFRPEGTFVALAALIGWFLLFKGTFDICLALTNRDADLWWLTLTVGVIEILLAFWAVGYFRGSAVLLIVWVAAAALARGVADIIQAFHLRRLRKELLV